MDIFGQMDILTLWNLKNKLGLLESGADARALKKLESYFVAKLPLSNFLREMASNRDPT